MESVSLVRFFGGPEDGRVDTRPRGCKWAAYRDADGGPLGTVEGDRILSTGEGHCYVLYVRRHRSRVERLYVWSALVTRVSRRYGLRRALKQGDARIPMLKDLYEIVSGERMISRLLALAEG